MRWCVLRVFLRVSAVGGQAWGVCTSFLSSVSGQYLKSHIQVVLAPVFHLFPSRTEKLSPGAPMVLHRNAGE